MKKAELTVGMKVEDASGYQVTVVEVGGWVKGDAWSKWRPFTYGGVEYHVWGRRDNRAHGVLVLRGNGGEIYPLRGLFPVGTKAAENKQRQDYRDQRRVENEARVAKVRARLGGNAGLLDRLFITVHPDGSLGGSDRLSTLETTLTYLGYDASKKEPAA